MKSEFPGYVYGSSGVVAGQRVEDRVPGRVIYGMDHQLSRSQVLEKSQQEGACCSPEQRDLFAGFWHSSRELELAWALRSIVMEQLGRPEELLMHPEEPLAVWEDSDYDSLDQVEFISTLESVFGIEIPDEDSDDWFTTHSMSDAVGYIMLKAYPEEIPA